MRTSVAWTAAMWAALGAAGLHAADFVAAPALGPPAVAAPAAKPALRHGVFRHTSYPAAWTSAQKANRPILVFATAPSCPHCVRMISQTYRSPQVKGFLNDSFETVYVDRSEQPELAAKLGVRWFPTTIVVGRNNEVLDVIEGYVDSKTLARRLQTTMAAQSAATQTR